MGKKNKFDPEGTGYDYKAAQDCGLEPNKDGKWPSRCPGTGQLLKGKQHETWTLTEDEEKRLGYSIIKGPDGKYYSKESE